MATKGWSTVGLMRASQLKASTPRASWKIAMGMTTRPSTVPIETLAFGGMESFGERGRAPTANIATLSATVHAVRLWRMDVGDM